MFGFCRSKKILTPKQMDTLLEGVVNALERLDSSRKQQEIRLDNLVRQIAATEGTK